MIVKTLVGSVFAAAFVLGQSVAFAECTGDHAKTASAPATPVQTAEAPKSSKTK